MGKISDALKREFFKLSEYTRKQKELKKQIQEKFNLDKDEFHKKYVLYLSNKYYNDRKPEIEKKDRNQIITCKCGIKVKRKNIKIHEISNRHKKRMDELKD